MTANKRSPGLRSLMSGRERGQGIIYHMVEEVGRMQIYAVRRRVGFKTENAGVCSNGADALHWTWQGIAPATRCVANVRLNGPFYSAIEYLAERVRKRASRV